MKFSDYIRAKLGAEPRSMDDSDEIDESTRWWSEVRGDGIDIREPPEDEYEKYWRQFETCPLVREPIRDFSREVLSPGYRVNAESDETEQFLSNWTSRCAIIAGEQERDMLEFLDSTLVQREVRGISIIEHVPDSETETFDYLKHINPGTVEILTRDNSNIILQPNDDYDDAPTTPDGDTAAYVQFSDSEAFEERDEVRLSADEVTKVVRDADVSDVYGTSRLESVSKRIEALMEKLESNDAAIQSKAWPFWLFKFGSAENPWPESKISGFMKEHSESDFSAGKKQAVKGDVSLETVSGEVADIEESVQFDVDYILSAMPVPKYTVGFESDINQFVSKAQEERFEEQVRAARRELESEITPILKKRAEEEGLPTDGIELKIKPPEEESPFRADEIDMGEVKEFADAVETISGGAPAEVISQAEFRDFLGLPEESDVEAEAAEGFDEEDEQVQEFFEDSHNDSFDAEADD